MGSPVTDIFIAPYYKGLYLTDDREERRLSDYPTNNVVVNINMDRTPGQTNPSFVNYIKDNENNNLIAVEVLNDQISRSRSGSVIFQIYFMPEFLGKIRLTDAVLTLYADEDLVMSKTDYGYSCASIAGKGPYLEYEPEPALATDVVGLAGAIVLELLGTFLPGLGVLAYMAERYSPTYLYGTESQVVDDLDPNNWDAWQASWDEYGTSPLPNSGSWNGATVVFFISSPNEGIGTANTLYYYLMIQTRHYQGPLENNIYLSGWSRVEDSIVLMTTG